MRAAPPALPADRPVVLFVGRIQPLKAPDVAVQALAQVHRDDALLVLVGGASGIDGEAEVERTKQLVFDLGLTDRVRFVRPQPHHILSSYYRAADVVLVPSRSESFGLVALEAAACGIPVVASAVGGLLNIVHDGVTGLLVEGRDPARFARAIDQVLADPHGRRGDGRGRRGAGSPVHVELHGGPPPTALHRPCGAAPARALVACSVKRAGGSS